MSSYEILKEGEITNQCVLICDLKNYHNPESACWAVIKGTQDQVGFAIAAKLKSENIARIDDFGGVCKTFLCEGESYLTTPPKTKSNAAIFSFTPKKRVLSEGHDMARVASNSGYHLLILTLQKHDKFGKIWVLGTALRHTNEQNFVYYEDTGSVIDELKLAPEIRNVVAVHVLSPGFEEHTSQYADRVVTQQEYKDEVLHID